MNSITLEILLPLIYIIPSLILYTIELFIMIFYRHDTKFTGSFFTIFVCCTINNIFCEVFYFLTYRAPKAPIFISIFLNFSESGFFITLPIFITYLAGAVQPMLDLCICFNRFTVFALRAKHFIFWKKWCKIILIAVYAIGIGITWWVGLLQKIIITILVWTKLLKTKNVQFLSLNRIFREAWLFQVKIIPASSSDINAGFNWGVTDTSAVSWMNIPIIIAANVTITAIWSLMMNLYVCWFLLKRNMTKKTTVGGFVISAADMRLFFFNLLLFGTQATQFALQVGLPIRYRLCYDFFRWCSYFIRKHTLCIRSPLEHSS